MSDFTSDFEYDHTEYSGWCRLPLIDDKSVYGDVDLSIVVNKDGKYGLIQTDTYIEDNGVTYESEELVVDFQYDNLYLEFTVASTYLITSQNGKQGTILLYSASVNRNSAVICDEILPCVYNKVCTTTEFFCDILLLSTTDGMRYFNPETGVLSDIYDRVDTLTSEIISCSSDEASDIIDISADKTIYRTENGWNCNYVCRYTDKYVLRVMKFATKFGEPKWKSRLLFYSKNSGEVIETAVYEQIKIHAVDKEHGCFYMTGFDIMEAGKWRHFNAGNVYWSDCDIKNLEGLI